MDQNADATGGGGAADGEGDGSGPRTDSGTGTDTGGASGTFQEAGTLNLGELFERDPLKAARISPATAAFMPTQVTRVLGVDRNQDLLADIRGRLHVISQKDGSISAPLSESSNYLGITDQVGDCQASKRYIFTGYNREARRSVFAVDYGGAKVVDLLAEMNPVPDRISLELVSGAYALASARRSDGTEILLSLPCLGGQPVDLLQPLAGKFRFSGGVKALVAGGVLVFGYCPEDSGACVATTDGASLTVKALRSNKLLRISAKDRVAAVWEKSLRIYPTPDGAPVTPLGADHTVEGLYWDEGGDVLGIAATVGGLSRFYVYDVPAGKLSDHGENPYGSRALLFQVMTGGIAVRLHHMSSLSGPGRLVATQADKTAVVLAEDVATGTVVGDSVAGVVFYARDTGGTRTLDAVEAASGKVTRLASATSGYIHLDRVKRQVYFNVARPGAAAHTVARVAYDGGGYDDFAALGGVNCGVRADILPVPGSGTLLVPTAETKGIPCATRMINPKTGTEEAVRGSSPSLTGEAVVVRMPPAGGRHAYLTGSFTQAFAQDLLAFDLESKAVSTMYSAKAGEWTRFTATPEPVLLRKAGAIAAATAWTKDLAVAGEFKFGGDGIEPVGQAERLASGHLILVQQQVTANAGIRALVAVRPDGTLSRISPEGAALSWFHVSRDRRVVIYVANDPVGPAIHVANGQESERLTAATAQGVQWVEDLVSGAIVYVDQDTAGSTVYAYDPSRRSRVQLAAPAEKMTRLVTTAKGALYFTQSGIYLYAGGDASRRLTDRVLAADLCAQEHGPAGDKLVCLQLGGERGRLWRLDLSTGEIVETELPARVCQLKGINAADDVLLTAGAACLDLMLVRADGEVRSKALVQPPGSWMRLLGDGRAVFYPSKVTGQDHLVQIWNPGTGVVMDLVRLEAGRSVYSPEVDPKGQAFFFSANSAHESLFSVYRLEIPPQ